MRKGLLAMAFASLLAAQAPGGDKVLFNGKMDPEVVRHWYTPSKTMKAAIDPAVACEGMPSLGLTGSGSDPWTSAILYMANGKAVDLEPYKALEFKLQGKGELSLQVCLKGSNGPEKDVASKHVLIKKYLKDSRYPAEGQWAQASIPLSDFIAREGKPRVASLESVSFQHRDKPGGEFWLADIRLTDRLPQQAASNAEIKRSNANVTINDVKMRLAKDNVEKWDYAEIALSISHQGLTNGFDPDELDVVGEAKGPNGENVPLIGFYDGNSDGSYSPAGDCWRVRVSPSSEGKWTCDLRVSGSGKEQKRLSCEFNCVPPSKGNHGFISVDKKEPLLFQYSDGMPLLMNGIHAIRSEIGVRRAISVFETHPKLNAMTIHFWHGFSDIWDNLSRNLGGSNSYGDITAYLPDPKGLEQKRKAKGMPGLPPGYPMDMALGLDRYNLPVIQKTEKNILLPCKGMGVAVDIHLFNQMTFSSYDGAKGWITSMWRNNPYNADNGGPCVVGADLFTNPRALFYVERQVRYCMARWAPLRNAIWVYMNEMMSTDGANGNKGESAYEFCGAMSKMLDKYDPYRHLRAVSCGPPDSWGGAFADMWTIHGISFRRQERALEKLDNCMGKWLVNPDRPVFIDEAHSVVDTTKVALYGGHWKPTPPDVLSLSVEKDRLRNWWAYLNRVHLIRQVDYQVFLDDRHVSQWQAMFDVLSSYDVLNSKIITSQTSFENGGSVDFISASDGKKIVVYAINAADAPVDGASVKLPVKALKGRWIDPETGKTLKEGSFDSDKIAVPSFSVDIAFIADEIGHEKDFLKSAGVKPGKVEGLFKAAARMSWASAPPELMVSVYNVAAQVDMPVSLRLETPEGVRLGGFEAKYKMPACGKALDIRIPVTEIPPATDSYIKVTVESLEQTLRIDVPLRFIHALKAKAPPSFDDESWKLCKPVEINAAEQFNSGKEKWKGKDELSASFRFLYDDKNLYMLAEVLDDKLMAPPPGPVWNGDNVQMLLSPFTKGMLVAGEMVKPRLHWTFLPGSLWGKADIIEDDIIKEVSSAKMQAGLRSGGYAVMASVPWSEAGLTPRQGLCGLVELLLCDADSAGGREKQMIWSSRSSLPWVDISGFGALVLDGN